MIESKNYVDRTIDALKKESGILGVDMTSVITLGSQPLHFTKCSVYEDVGNFIPKLLFEVVLSEEQIEYMLSQAGKEIWMLKDQSSDLIINTTYFSAHEPKIANWVKTK